MVKNETMVSAGLGGWIGSVVSVFLTRSILPTDTFWDVIIKGGLTTLIVTIVILAGIKILKI